MRRVLWLGVMIGAMAFAQEGEHHGEPQPSDMAADPSSAADHEATPANGHEEAPHDAMHAPAHGAAAEHGGAAAEHGGGHEDKHDVGGFIMHHLADSNEYEFEIPLNDNEPNPTLHLPQILIPLKAGACPADPHLEHPSLTAGCLDLSITKHLLMMWLAAALLLLTFLLGSHRDKSQLVPKGARANLLEMLVLFVRDEMAVKNIGKEHAAKYTPYLLTAFFFILFMNLLGLFPWMSAATGNVAVTCGLAICTFIMTQVAGIRAAGFKTWLAHLTGGVAWWLWPIMIPVEVLGLFTKPFALTIRLFANMLAGHIVIFFLLGLIFILRNAGVAIVSVPFAMAIYFLELFVAFVQAYIFTMLSSLFIGMGVAMAHHGGHDDHGHDAHGHDAHGGHAEGAHAHDHGKAHA